MDITTLQAFGNVYTAIRYAETQYGTNPIKNLIKPVLPIKHTKEDIEKYLVEFSEYEKLLEKFNNIKKSHQQHCNEINKIVVEFIKEESGLTGIPIQYRDKVYNKVYDSHHGSGFHDIYLELCDLVEIFD